MAKIEDTVGNVTYTIPNCDCGLTGGCDKCQPLCIPRHSDVEYIFLETHEERFLSPDLERFYKKKGYI